MVMQSDVEGKVAMPDEGVGPDIHTPLPGPTGEPILRRDDAVISPSYTRSYPFVMSHGKGCYVWDVDGNRFIDFTAGVAVLNTGHTHPEVVKAIQEQAEKYIHMAGTDFYLPNVVELAEELNRITPGDFDKQVFFTNSGSESVDSALKIALSYHRARGEPGRFASAPFREFHRDIAAKWVPEKRAVAFSVRQHGETVAALYGFIVPR